MAALVRNDLCTDDHLQPTEEKILPLQEGQLALVDANDYQITNESV